MFDDVLKGAKKASKNNKVDNVEEVKSALTDKAPHSPIDDVVSSNTPKKRKSSGKRTDPNFKQVGAYIRKDTYLQIQRLLLERPDQDFSDLVEELLTDYLNNQVSD